MKSRITHASGSLRALCRGSSAARWAALACLILGGCAAGTSEPYPRLTRFPPVPVIPSPAEWQALRQQLAIEHQEGEAIAATAHFTSPADPSGAGAQDLSAGAK